jgi:hypothetical protein
VLTPRPARFEIDRTKDTVSHEPHA